MFSPYWQIRRAPLASHCCWFGFHGVLVRRDFQLADDYTALSCLLSVNAAVMKSSVFMNLETHVPVFTSITATGDGSTLLVLLSKFYYVQLSSPIIKELLKFVICNLYFLCVLISVVASVGLPLFNMIQSAYYTFLFWMMREVWILLSHIFESFLFYFTDSMWVLEGQLQARIP